MAGDAIRGNIAQISRLNVGVAAKNRNRHAGQSQWLSALAYLLTLICRQSGAIFIQVKSNQQQAVK